MRLFGRTRFGLSLGVHPDGARIAPLVLKQQRSESARRGVDEDPKLVRVYHSGGTAGPVLRPLFPAPLAPNEDASG